MNWQNVPRDDKTVKRAVVPKRGAFLYADYKSIEPRLAAYYAAKTGFPEFAEQIRAGADPYTAVAQLVTGKSKVTEEERGIWKIMFLSLMYGGGTYTIQQQFGVGHQEARKMIRTFHDGWPAVRALSDGVQAAHEKRGFIRSIGGRHLHAEENGSHKLANKLVQGGAADIMIAALLNIYRWLHANPSIEGRMVSVIHDEVIFDLPKEELPLLAKELPRLMDFPLVSKIVPIQVDLEFSLTSWAEKHPWLGSLDSSMEKVASLSGDTNTRTATPTTSYR